MAWDLVISIAGKIAEYFVDPIGRQIGYVFNYNRNIQKLEDEVKELSLAKERVQHSVDEARRNPANEIHDDVKDWLTRVNDVTAKAEKILRANHGADKRCFMGLCPNSKTRYRFSRKANKQILDVVEVREKGKFGSVSYRIPPQVIVPVKNYEAFESRTSVLEGIMEALKGTAVNLIGVYGMSGVGKTTLVKEVASKVKKDGIFRQAVMATVTHILDPKKIQQQIAEWLDYKFDVESVDVRATRLRELLNRQEKILVILDDIWAGINLEEIGIPFGNDHKGCKILMTSRNLNVLQEMGVERDFFVEILQGEESWHLFERKVGKLTDPNLQPVAIEVARKCAGLPVLIVATAMALKNRGIVEWNDALDRLKRVDNESIERRVYSALELSYNFLGGDEKSLFLLCGQLLPDIPILDLLKYSMGLGLFNQATALKAARNRLLKVVNNLKKACLLLEGKSDEYVKMHDVVHNFAASFASEHHDVFTVANETVLEEWPEKDILDKCTAISLPFCKIPKLPLVFESPKLKSLILYSNNPSLKIPESFFCRMQQLRVLDLTEVHLSLLPSSLQFLENLQTLCLDHCDLEDIAIIGELNKLQVLSMVGSTIIRLPREVGKLSRLRLLDLSGCQSLQVIPPGVLSCLAQLEVLYMRNSFVQWEGEGQHCPRNNANLAELKLLSNLNTLEFRVTDANILPNDLFSENLERFTIFIGDEWDWSGKYESSRILKLKLKTSNYIQLERVKVLLMRAEDLYLDDLRGFKNVIDELDGQGFPELKRLHVKNSPEIQYIIDCMGIRHLIVFPKLELLYLDNLNNLEKIFYGPTMGDSFSNLRKLKVENCNALENLFSFSTFRGLAQLEEIHVNRCEILKEIVGKETRDNSDSDEAIQLTELRTLTLEYLPRLSSFCSQVNVPSILGDESETLSLLFSKKIEFPNLVDLKLSSINVEKIWSNQILRELSPCIKNLTTLTVDGCGNLSYLFTSSMVGSLTQLKEVGISYCKSMEEVIVIKGEGDMMSKMLFPKLDSLKLKGLPTLTRFCSGNSIECPSLKELWIENCPHLQAFIISSLSANVGTSSGVGQPNSTLFDEKVLFPNLEELHVRDMHKLKMIWYDELQVDSFCRLKLLEVQHGEQLLKIFPSKLLRRFLNVETLIIKNCNLLQEVFDQVLMKKQETDVVSATQLRQLEMVELPNLKHVWSGDPHGILSFHNLSRVYAWFCPNLKNLFPFSVAQSLPQLEALNIDSCDGLEEVVAEERVDVEATPKFVFPQLKNLVLWRSMKLKCLYPEKHTLKCQLLECLNVYLCDSLETFSSEVGNSQTTHMESQLKIPQPLFSFREVIPKLKILGLDNKDTTMIRQGQFPSDRLEILQLHCFHDASADFPFDLLHKFQNIKRLDFRDCYFKVLFPHGIAGKAAGALAQLRYLQLNELRHMSHIWSNDCQPGDVFQNLQTLEIFNCCSLSTLAPSSASFQNLTTLEVRYCHGLVNLVASSTAKSMFNLTTLIVRQNNMVKEILANEGDETLIIFSKLESLELHGLKNLTSFCSSASCTIKFPSLQKVFVTQCPSMNVFSQGDISAPKLERVYLTEDRDKWQWIRDLNTTIKQLYEDWVGFSGLQHLKLSEFPQVKQVWHEQLPVNLFYNLNTLVVDDCAFKYSSVPSNLLPFLYNLEQLEVRNCEAVEQVFGWPNANGFVGHLSKLTSLIVDGCGNLKYLMSSSMVRSVVNLKRMEIIDCKKMEQVIVKEGLEEQTMISEMLLCELEFLKLENLPKLAQFCTSNFVECPALKDLQIHNCPELMTFVSNSASAVNAGELEIFINSTLFDEKVLFPNLEKLVIVNVHKLKMLWDDELRGDSFCSLKELRVEHGKELLKFFPSKQLRRFLNIESMVINDCDLVEELFDLQVLMKIQETDVVATHQLRYLDIDNLQKLKHVWNGDPHGILSFHNLGTMYAWNCPSLKNLFRLSVARILPQLELLSIDGCDGLEEVVAKEERIKATPKFVFPQLKTLNLWRSQELKCFYPEKHSLECTQLETLNVYRCDKLEIFTSEAWDLQRTSMEKQLDQSQLKIQVPKPFFSFGEVLKVSSSFDNEKIRHSHLLEMYSSIQNLTSLIVDGCANLKYLLSSSMIKSVVNLKRMEIIDCKKMEQVIVSWEGLEGQTMKSEILFPALEFLQLRHLPKLARFCTSDLIEFPALKELSIENCPVLMTFVSNSANADMAESSELEILNFTLFDEKVVFPNLEQIQISNTDTLTKIWHNQLHSDSFYKLTTLDIQNLPNLKHLWNKGPQQVLSFANLSSVDVGECPSLKSLFPASIATNLFQLEKIDLVRCGLEELVTKEEEVETNLMFVFPQLKSLDLWRLEELKCFYPGTHTLECPLLERLVVCHCDKLDLFVLKPDEKNLQETQMEKPLFSFREIVPNLKDLSLTSKDAKMISQGQFPADLFHKLEVIQINCFHDESAVFPFDLLQRFHSMEKLVVRCSKFKELFPYDEFVGKVNYVKITEQIRHLDLANLPDLENIWNQDSKLDQALKSLETLEIWLCNSLITLAPSSTSFQNLTTMDVKSCNGLVSLVTSSTAKSLVQLTNMNVRECEKLKEIVTKEGDDDGSTEEIIFNKLQSLQLVSLPKLKNFCSTKNSFQLPSLTQVIVSQCPEMQVFSKGVLITPMLQTLQETEEEDEQGRWNGNLNATIQRLFTEMNAKEC